jgi:predicted dehydrogenase
MFGSPISRRRFVRDVAAAGFAVHVVPRRVLGRGYRAPSDTLNVACVGVGGMGRNDVRGFEKENLVAFADVDWRSARDAFSSYPNAKRYKDWREMLERERNAIDAVTVTTPDHSHAVAAMAALQLGKHVYVQKPLTRTLWECRTLMREAAGRPGQVTQMGNQGHTHEGTRQIREWLEAGVLGTVREVHYWTNRPIWAQAMNRPTEAHHVPPWLDWDLWLGPMPARPYHPTYAPFSWRGWWDFGTGALGDMACHGMDAAFWALDLGYPSRVAAECTTLFEETAPRGSRVTYTFPARGTRPEVTLVWRDGSLTPPRPAELSGEARWPPWEGGGQLWVGERASLVADIYGDEPRLLDPAKDSALRSNPPAEKYPRSKGVYQEFIDACKGTGKTLSSFDGHAGPLTELVLLGCVAVRMGTTLQVNPETGDITSPAVPGELIRTTYRVGWST